MSASELHVGDRAKYPDGMGGEVAFVLSVHDGATSGPCYTVRLLGSGDAADD